MALTHKKLLYQREYRKNKRKKAIQEEEYPIRNVLPHAKHTKAEIDFMFSGPKIDEHLEEALIVMSAVHKKRQASNEKLSKKVSKWLTHPSA